MPRSAADATRFTAAIPHVYKKPNAPRPTPSNSTYSSLRQPLPGADGAKAPAPRGETPQQKVARLRAIRTAQRNAELPLWEKVVIRGRRVADVAHRTTAITLIVTSVLCVGLVGFAVTDMLLHNRRKRDAFYEQQHRIYTSKLLAAIETEKAGLPLTNDLQLVINRERLKVADEERKKAESYVTSFKGLLFGGLKKEDDSVAFRKGEDGQVILDGGRIPTEGEVLTVLGVDKLEVLKEATRRREEEEASTRGTPSEVNIEQDIHTKFADEPSASAASKGGVLDQMAENAANRVRGKR